MGDIGNIGEIAGALAGIIGCITGIIGAFKKLKKRHQRKKLSTGYSDISVIYRHIHELCHSTNLKRVLVLKSENGGGIPSPGSIVKQTVVFEASDSDLRSIQLGWQQVRIDEEYAKVLDRVVNAGDGVCDTESNDLKETSILRELMEASKMTRARFIRVCATESAVLYLCAGLDEHNVLEAETKLAIRSTALRLCEVFSSHSSLVAKVK